MKSAGDLLSGYKRTGQALLTEKGSASERDDFGLTVSYPAGKVNPKPSIESGVE